MQLNKKPVGFPLAIVGLVNAGLFFWTNGPPNADNLIVLVTSISVAEMFFWIKVPAITHSFSNLEIRGGLLKHSEILICISLST